MRKHFRRSGEEKPHELLPLHRGDIQEEVAAGCQQESIETKDELGDGAQRVMVHRPQRTGDDAHCQGLLIRAETFAQNR